MKDGIIKASEDVTIDGIEIKKGDGILFKNMETKEEVKLPKHLQAAVNQLQKQIDKNHEHITKYQDTARIYMERAETLMINSDELREQIKRLKGE